MLLNKIIELIKIGNSNYIDSININDIEINGASSLDEASQNEISFVEENNKIKEFIKYTNASALIVPTNDEIIKLATNKGISLIVVSSPRIAFAEVLNTLYEKSYNRIGIDERASIHSSALIGDDCYIGPNVFIGENCSIGNKNFIFPGTAILDNVEIGTGNIIYPNCVIHENTSIKDNCIINSNTVLGSEGFGFIPSEGKWLKMPQKGGVRVDNNVEIGTNCCIDRPAVGLTIIGEGTKLDNLVQIGHGVKIGKHCAFAAQVGIAGGAVIGNNVILAGQVGVNNRVKVGNNVIASSKCGIHTDIKDGEIISGFPAMQNKSWLRSSSIFKKLPELVKKLRQLDRQ